MSIFGKKENRIEVDEQTLLVYKENRDFLKAENDNLKEEKAKLLDDIEKLRQTELDLAEQNAKLDSELSVKKNEVEELSALFATIKNDTSSAQDLFIKEKELSPVSSQIMQVLLKDMMRKLEGFDNEEATEIKNEHEFLTTVSKLLFQNNELLKRDNNVIINENKRIKEIIEAYVSDFHDVLSGLLELEAKIGLDVRTAVKTDALADDSKVGGYYSDIHDLSKKAEKAYRILLLGTSEIEDNYELSKLEELVPVEDEESASPEEEIVVEEVELAEEDAEEADEKINEINKGNQVSQQESDKPELIELIEDEDVNGGDVYAVEKEEDKFQLDYSLDISDEADSPELPESAPLFSLKTAHYQKEGQELKKLRRSIPIEVELLAEKLNVEKGVILRLEEGELYMPAGMMKKYADFFGVNQSLFKRLYNINKEKDIDLTKEVLKKTKRTYLREGIQLFRVRKLVMKQNRLTGMSGIPGFSNIDRWERGESRPKIENTLKLDDIYKVPKGTFERLYTSYYQEKDRLDSNKTDFVDIIKMKQNKQI